MPAFCRNSELAVLLLPCLRVVVNDYYYYYYYSGVIPLTHMSRRLLHVFGFSKPRPPPRNARHTKIAKRGGTVDELGEGTRSRNTHKSTGMCSDTQYIPTGSICLQLLLSTAARLCISHYSRSGGGAYPPSIESYIHSPAHKIYSQGHTQ